MISSYIYLKHLLSTYKFIFLSLVGVLVFGFIFGLFAPSSFKAEMFKSVFAKFSEFSSQKPTLFYQIFLNNLNVAFLDFISGFLVFVPFVILLVNGLILGVAVDFLFRISQLGDFYRSLPVLLAAFVPHGIIEIPVIVISAFLPVLIGLKIIFKKRIEPKDTRRAFLGKVGKVYIFVIIPLLLLAALIESFVSTTLSQKLASRLLTKQQVSEDASLNSVILQGEDFEKLNLQIREEKTEKSEAPPEGNVLGSIVGLLIYNEDVYRAAKKIKRGHHVYRFYRLSDGTILAIQISKFETSKDAVDNIALMGKIVNSFEDFPNNMNISPLGNGFYKFTKDQKIVYLRFGSVNDYAYSMSYDGKSLEDFSKLVDLQVKKITPFTKDQS